MSEVRSLDWECKNGIYIPPPRHLHPSIPLQAVLGKLFVDEKGREQHTCEQLLKWRQFCIAEFWRSELDSTFPLAKPFYGSKKLIEAEVGLWKKLLRLLERLDTLGIISDSALAFGSLLVERQMALFYFFRANEPVGATQAIKGFQVQNRQLQSLTNPFAEKYSSTCHTIEAAICLADRADKFRSDYYMPVVRRRMALVALMKKTHARIFWNGRLVQSGRKVAS